MFWSLVKCCDVISGWVITFDLIVCCCILDDADGWSDGVEWANTPSETGDWETRLSHGWLELLGKIIFNKHLHGFGNCINIFYLIKFEGCAGWGKKIQTEIWYSRSRIKLPNLDGKRTLLFFLNPDSFQNVMRIVVVSSPVMRIVGITFV